MKEEEVRSSLEGASRETLADALAIVLAEGNAPNRASVWMTKPELENFAEALQYLKKEYHFEELKLFSTEADLVYVQTGDRRVLLTDRANGLVNTISQNMVNAYIDKDHFLLEESVDEDKNNPCKDGGRFSHLEL